MNATASLAGIVRCVVLGLVLCATPYALSAAEVTVTRTNWVERWITNVIDVNMPRNQFVNVYRTNWITQLRTNAVDVYATNWTMRKLTNVIEISATWTNQLTAYWTNWTIKILTNHVAVNCVRTNLVDRYHTNWSALDLTNWVTVVRFKTNWVSRAMTNLVQLDLPEPSPVAAPAAREEAEPKEAAVETSPAAPGPSAAGALVIEAARTASPTAEGLVEVLLKVRWSAASSAPLQVQRWRVERDDGTMLFSGQDQEFKHQLPVGKYKVEARLQSKGTKAPLVARGTLSVTTREALIQPRLLVRK